MYETEKMAPTGESGVGDPSKTCENIESETSKCKHCKKVVKEKVQCKKCKQIFHPSCLVVANKSKNSACVHEVDEKQDITEKLMSEIELLKKIINEQEEKYELLMENKKLLEENIKLLRQNNDLLHDKVNEKTRSYKEIVAKENTKSEPIKNQAKKAHKQTTIDESGNQLFTSIQGPSSSTGRDVHENEKKDEAKSSETIPEISPHNHSQGLMRQDRENKGKHNPIGRKNFNSKNKKPLFYGTSEEGSVKGIPRRIWYFVSRLCPDMTEEQLKSIIKKQCPNIDIVVEKQKLYYEYQSAFKVGVPVECEDKANNANFWPKDSKINRFNFFLERKKMQQGK